MVKIYLTALGCKLNQAEVEALSRQAELGGHQVVSSAQEADWAIINTCTVTHVADRKSRGLIRHLHRLNPRLRLAVTGCYAQMWEPQLRAIEGVDLVVPNADKPTILAALLAAAESAGETLTGGTILSRHPLRTRALVKIQDGCDHRCAYCVVTHARGPSRSVAPQSILEEIHSRVREGHQEIVLTGVNIGAYGLDRGPEAALPPKTGWSLARLLREILASSDVRRLRLSSIEPQHLQPDLLEAWQDSRICPHVHLPLQAGCDAALRRMRRPYTTSQYAALVARLRAIIPDVSITADVMVGFPGEDEAEFQATHDFCQSMAFSRLHVFQYSRRPGTDAAAMPDPVDPRVARTRSEKLIGLGRYMARDFHEQHLGRTLEVLFERVQDDESPPIWDGLTGNYVRVSVPSDRDLANKLCAVRCLQANQDGIAGALVGCA